MSENNSAPSSSPSSLVPTTSENGTSVQHRSVVSPPRETPFAPRELSEDERTAWYLCKSGFFADSKGMAQAMTKMILGRTMGLDPASSMMGIFINGQQKLCLSANLMASRIKSCGKYKYKVLEHNAKVCQIEYFEKVVDEATGKLSRWESLGIEVTRIEDFKHLTSQPWKLYPKNMLFARNISNAAKFYTPDAFGGSPVYLPDEIPDSGIEVDGQTLEVVSVKEKVTSLASSSSPSTSVQDAEIEESSSTSTQKRKSPLNEAQKSFLHLCEESQVDQYRVISHVLKNEKNLSDLTDDECKRLEAAVRARKSAQGKAST